MVKKNRPKSLTLFQIWSAKRALESKVDEPGKAVKIDLPRRMRRFARILKVYVPKARKPKSYEIEPMGKVPTARFVQGGRPESNRRS